jgi:hypothetical protein
MRNLAHLTVIIVCLLLGLLVITMMDYWQGANEMSDVQQGQIMHGRIESWAWSETTRSRYPTLMPLSRMKVLYNLRALLATVPLFFVMYYALRIKRKSSLLTVGLASLGVGAIPYAIGRLALLYNTDIANSGPWVGFMLLGVLYATAGCMFFALLGLLFTNVNTAKSKPAAKSKERQAIAASY